MGIKETAIKIVANTTKTLVNETVKGFAKNGTATIVKNIDIKARKGVRIPSSAEDYYHRNFQEVKEELTAYGFTNIILLERKDLVMGLVNRNGSIEEISIDGKANFRKNSKFHSDARVVIIYHGFREWK